jgi:NAD(P)-dependent dehydrogenase (short-subunit alcohol dehydrogenase family)
VVVTGGGTGLGKAIATEFGRLGAAVGILSRDEKHRAAGVAAVEEAGGTALAVACDIRDADAIRSAFDAVESTLGPIDVLINNAAGNFPVPAEDMSPNAWRTVVDIVLNGTYLCCRDLARRLIPAERDGAIVNIGASYAWTGGPGFAHSAAAKAGVKNLTETLAVEWAPYGIRVNGLVPGLIPHADEVAAITALPGRRCRPVGWANPVSSVGPPRSSAPPLPATSAVTRWWSMGPTGSAGALCNHHSWLSANNWGGRRSASPVPAMERATGKPMMRPLSDEDRKLVTLEVDGPIAVITNISGAGAMTRPFACN